MRPPELKNMAPATRIITALDVATGTVAMDLIDQLAPEGAKWFKVGHELISAGVAGVVTSYANKSGAAVFWDGKFHDIPQTVARGVEQAVKQGASMVNVMAAAGPTAMRAAVEAAGAAWLIAVTVPTSMDDAECRLVYGADVATTVRKFAEMAAEAGCHGIVCSPRDLPHLDGLEDLIKVTPGVRPIWAAAGDQKRVMTPGQAVMNGSDFVVVGRPITKPPAKMGSPVSAFKAVVDNLRA